MASTWCTAALLQGPEASHLTRKTAGCRWLGAWKWKPKDIEAYGQLHFGVSATLRRGVGVPNNHPALFCRYNLPSPRVPLKTTHPSCCFEISKGKALQCQSSPIDLRHWVCSELLKSRILANHLAVGQN